MKRSALLLTLALAPLALTGSRLSASDGWSEGWYPDRAPYESDGGGRYIDSFGDPYIPADELAAARRGADRRIAEPYLPPPRPWREPSAGPDYPGYQEPGGGGPPDYRDRGSYSGAGRPPWELPPHGGAEYRFRGDESAGTPTWALAPGRDGYRFRPLTDVERDRIRGESQWWSGPAIDPQGRSEPRGPTSGDRALGYEPDNWFGRHYGDRP